MRLVEKFKQEIKQTAKSSELEALMNKIRQQLKAGNLTSQEYYFLVVVRQKHFQANIAAINGLLPDLSNNNLAVNSIKVDECEIVAEEFEAIERDFANMSEITKKFT